MLSKVLIVDDAYSMRNLIKKALREAGYEVVGEAKNGNEGLQQYELLKPDFVTMDIKMPDMSGIEVTKQIIERYPDARIIAISGNNDPVIKQEIMDAGAIDYLRKPFQPAFLLTKIEKMLEMEQVLIVETVVEKTNPALVDPVVKPPQDELDDFFENVEIVLSDKPDETKTRLLVIENQEDLFEFPEEYPVEEEASKHSLTLASIEDESLEEPTGELVEPTFPLSEKEDVVIELSVPHQDAIVDNSPIAPFTEEIILSSTSKQEEFVSFEVSNADSIQSPFSEPQPVSSPIRIRPPKGKKLTPTSTEVEPDESEEFEDFVIDTSSEDATMTSDKKKGVFGFVKNLFKS